MNTQQPTWPESQAQVNARRQSRAAELAALNAIATQREHAALQVIANNGNTPL